MQATIGLRTGSLEEAAAEHGVAYSTVRVWASRLNPSFPAPLDRAWRPHVYDLNAIAAWRASRPPRRRKTT